MQGALRTGQMLKDKYRLEALLGSGGMGDVYRARNVLVDRTVAIKALHPRHSKNEELVGRFMREARAANAVRHRHIVDVLDIDRDERGIPFIVQEYLDGEDLAARLERPPHRLSPGEALDLLLPVIVAVGVAHDKGVVHRDLKPDNVFLARVDGAVVPKILDFGISKIDVEEEIRRQSPASIPPKPMSHRLTAAGAAMGTPAYMSPEQIRDPRSVDARTDVWAIGVMLYEVLSGKMPFDAEDLAGLFVVIQTSEPAALDRVAPAVPKALARIVHRCLAPEPSARYANAAELADALRGYCERAAQAKRDVKQGRAPSHSLLPADVVGLTSTPPTGSDPPLSSRSTAPPAKPSNPQPFELELELDMAPPVSQRPRPSSPRPPTSSAPSLGAGGSSASFDDDDDLVAGHLDVDLAIPVPTSQRPGTRPSGPRAAATAHRPEADRGINVRRRGARAPSIAGPAIAWIACTLVVTGVAAGAPYLSPSGIARARAALGPLTWQAYTAGAALYVTATLGVASAGIRRVSYALFLAALGLTAASAAAIAATGVLAAPGLLPPAFRKLSLFGAPWGAIATLVGLALFAFDRGRALRRDEDAPLRGWWLTLSSLVCLAGVAWLGICGPRVALDDVTHMSMVPAETRARKQLADFAVVTAGAHALEARGAEK